MKTIIIALAVLSIGQAQASTPIQQKLPAQAQGTVEIGNIAGEVSVTGWRRNEIQVTGMLGDGVERVEFTTDGDRTVIRVHLHRNDRSYRDGSARLLISVPRGSGIIASTVSADLSVSGVTGPLELNTVSGDVSVEGAGIVRASLHSVSGDLGYTGMTARAGHYEFMTVSGAISMSIQGKPDAVFDLSTFSGDIRNAFGPDAQRTSRYTPGKALQFSEGKGEAEVRLRSLSGDLTLRRK